MAVSSPGMDITSLLWRLCARSCISTVFIIGSQDGSSWKGPLEVIQSNLPAQAGLPRAQCSGLCPDGQAGVEGTGSYLWEISVCCLSWAEMCLLGLSVTKMESMEVEVALFTVPVQAHS